MELNSAREGGASSSQRVGGLDPVAGAVVVETRSTQPLPAPQTCQFFLGQKDHFSTSVERHQNALWGSARWIDCAASNRR